MSNTTIQVPFSTRDAIKRAAAKRAKKMGITKLSMVDYLSLITKEE
jgi:hypothetical protein